MNEEQNSSESNIVPLNLYLRGRIVDGHCNNCHEDVSFIIPLIKECGMSRPTKCPNDNCRAQLLDSEMAVTEIVLRCTNCNNRLESPYPEDCPYCGKKLNYQTVKKKKLPTKAKDRAS